MSKIFFVLPAYNEEANIAETIGRWYPVVEKVGADSRLVIANDGSKDKTMEIMESLKDKYPQFIPLSKPNSGHGPTVIYLYKYADGETNPDEFRAGLEASREDDGVMGCRPVRGDGKDRKMVENVLRSYVWLFFHVWVPDANAPFRLMKASVVKKYINLMPSDFNLPNAVLAACFSKFRERVKYIDITFKPRQGGVNSINPKKILKIGWKAISDFWKVSREVCRKTKD